MPRRHPAEQREPVGLPDVVKRIAVAALMITLSACGSEETVAEHTSLTPTTEPVPSTRNIITEGVHDKRVGQPGGFGCGDGPDAVCDALFTVTAIERNPPCPGASASAGKLLLRIDVDVEASATFQFAVPEKALLLANWAVETGDGALHDLVMVDACSTDAGVFVRPLVPATHPRDSVVVVAPSRATWLWLKYENTAYRWPVRPPV
jgi:hypothetical protein